MATSTFDKVFIVTDPKERKKVIEIIDSTETAKPPKYPAYTEDDRDRSEELLKQFFSRFKS